MQIVQRGPQQQVCSFLDIYSEKIRDGKDDIDFLQSTIHISINAEEEDNITDELKSATSCETHCETEDEEKKKEEGNQYML